jgi:hypothetical protein
MRTLAVSFAGRLAVLTALAALASCGAEDTGSADSPAAEVSADAGMGGSGAGASPAAPPTSAPAPDDRPDAATGAPDADDPQAEPLPDADDPSDPPGPDATDPDAGEPSDPPLEPVPDAGDPPNVPDPGPCPPDVVCVDRLPFRDRGDTRGGPRTVDRYACAPDVDESGPERRYRIDVAHEGLLAVSLTGLDPGTDVDVHLLAGPAPDDCLDRGHWRAAAWVRPGTYWIVVDTWVDAQGEPLPGAYTLDVALTDAAALAVAGLDPEVADRALRVFARAWAREDTDRLEYAIVDFTLESALPREWIVDLATGEVLWHLHVTHGEASAAPGDAARAVAFSNIPESHQSSLGLMRSAETYTGDYGYSFRLDGLEPGYNDNVRRRDIVMHPWEDARPEAIDARGALPTSWGCPAIDDRIASPVVDLMSGGALYWFWYPDGDWSEQSVYLTEP